MSTAGEAAGLLVAITGTASVGKSAFLQQSIYACVQRTPELAVLCLAVHRDGTDSPYSAWHTPRLREIRAQRRHQLPAARAPPSAH